MSFVGDRPLRFCSLGSLPFWRGASFVGRFSVMGNMRFPSIISSGVDFSAQFAMGSN